MNRLSLFAAAPICAAALTLTGFLALTPGSARASITLPFVFDDTYTGAIDSTIVGSGTFTFGTNPGDGLYTAAQLGGVSYSFTLYGDTFNETGDITFGFAGYDTDYLLTTTPAGLRVQFRPLAFFSKYLIDTSFTNIVLFDYFANDGVYATDLNGGFSIGDYYIGNLSDVPEPGAIAFGVMAAGSVLGLVARKRRK